MPCMQQSACALPASALTCAACGASADLESTACPAQQCRAVYMALVELESVLEALRSVWI